MNGQYLQRSRIAANPTAVGRRQLAPPQVAKAVGRGSWLKEGGRRQLAPPQVAKAVGRGSWLKEGGRRQLAPPQVAAGGEGS
jgi:hypothetical protein